MSSNLKLLGNKNDFRENFKLDAKHKLGEGSFGKVYKAKNLNDDKIYAVKVFNGVSTMDQFMYNMMEVMGLMRIGSTQNQATINIHQIFAWIDKVSNDIIEGSNESEMVLAITIDYCDGGSLKSLIESHRDQNKKLPNDLLEDYARKLILGFSGLISESKLHHRDIKPDNILIDKNNVKIVDFNTCKVLSSSKNTLLVVIINW